MAKPDGWDWLQKVPVWDFHELAVKGWPDWEREPGAEEPLRVNLSFVFGEGESSRKLAVAFDDVATAPFYYRDFTDDGIPFCSKGDPYRSAFWFARAVDKEAFMALLRTRQEGVSDG